MTQTDWLVEVVPAVVVAGMADVQMHHQFTAPAPPTALSSTVAVAPAVAATAAAPAVATAATAAEVEAVDHDVVIMLVGDVPYLHLHWQPALQAVHDGSHHRGAARLPRARVRYEIQPRDVGPEVRGHGACPGRVGESVRARAPDLFYSQRGSELESCYLYGVVWYGMVWYGMEWYGMVWYGVMVWSGMAWLWYDMQIDTIR